MPAAENRNDKDGSVSWIADAEKYALVGLGAKAPALPLRQFTAKLWVFVDRPFKVPQPWPEWIGSNRTKEIEGFNLFLLSKQASETPDILDGENVKLTQRVWEFYMGLLLASPFAPSHEPVLLTGSRRNGELDIRKQQNLDPLVPCIFRPYPDISLREIELAARLGSNLEALVAAPLDGGHWRLNRTLSLYVEARGIAEILERLHQFCRCIDGLILPDPGNSKRQFKSKTELFIGPRHHDMMGEIYDARSASEHLHENRYLESFDRETRLDLLKKEATIEFIARSALMRIVNKTTLWPHFANTTALAKFWALSEAERRQLWGDTFDTATALVDFDARLIHDGHLGA